MITDRFELINEEFYAPEVSPAHYDLLLADGWRHFGIHFFRYNLGVYEDQIRRVMPLRVNLADFGLSKSQRRTLAKNQDVAVEKTSVVITEEITALFERHKRRFKAGVPASLADFLGVEAHGSPVPLSMLCVRIDGRLVAASFIDEGRESISSIYGIFDPDEAARRLGIFTMLKEIEYATSNAKRFYYHGYAYEGPSFYDYKKRFSGLEAFDWHGDWRPVVESS